MRMSLNLSLRQAHHLKGTNQADCLKSGYDSESEYHKSFALTLFLRLCVSQITGAQTQSILHRCAFLSYVHLCRSNHTHTHTRSRQSRCIFDCAFSLQRKCTTYKVFDMLACREALPKHLHNLKVLLAGQLWCLPWIWKAGYGSESEKTSILCVEIILTLLCLKKQVRERKCDPKLNRSKKMNPAQVCLSLICTSLSKSVMT